MIRRDASESQTVVWDLLLVGGLIVFTNVSVFVTVLSETPLRIVLGFPFVVFLPGYSIIALLFPAKNNRVIASSTPTNTSTEIDLAERIGLSVALSVATVGLIGLGLSALGVGVGLQPVMWTVSAVSLIALAVAWVRRWRLSVEERFAPSLPKLWVSEPAVSGRVNLLLNIAVVVAVLIAGAGAAFGVSGFNSNQNYTELSILSESATGQPTADSYPTNLTRGEPTTLFVDIDNHEGRPMTYTTIVEIQRLSSDGQTVARKTITRFQTTLSRDQGVRRPVQVEAYLKGEKLRLAVLLYRGDTERTSIDGAYREVHYNVTVAEANR